MAVDVGDEDELETDEGGRLLERHLPCEPVR